MTLSKNHLEVLRFTLKSQIIWGAGGCFGDGESITKKGDYRLAKRILTILDKELEKTND